MNRGYANLSTEPQLLQAALYYAEKLNYSVIPVGVDKKPLIPWRQFQGRKATSAEIREWWANNPKANIGIVTGAISGLVVVDIDEAVGYDEFNAIVPDSLIFPTATSPSGGKHYYFKATDKIIPTKARFLPGLDIRSDGGYITAPPSTRKEGNYTWDKGLRISDVELPPLPDKFYELSSGQNRTKSETSGQIADTSGQAMFVNGRRDDDLFHVSNCLFRGGMPDYEVSQVIHSLARQCGFPEDEASIKVRSALDRAEKKDRNLQGDVRQFVDESTGVFELHSIYNHLSLKERKEKKNVSDALSRLCKDGIIERVGNKNGHYRKVDNSIIRMNLKGADRTGEYDITLPLGLNSLVRILPKSIIIVAGNKNAGKSAFMLNIVHDNMGKHEIRYCNSEAGEQELAERTDKFDEPVEFWDNAEFIERSSDFSDVILPDGLNIIDYLELDPEKTYMVTQYLKNIHDKLKTGVAVVALQKKTGMSHGIGGEGSLEKARLYVTLDDNKITVQKGKIWRTPGYNPNGMQRPYKLVNGCKFIADDSWDMAEDKPTFKGRM